MKKKYLLAWGLFILLQTMGAGEFYIVKNGAPAAYFSGDKTILGYIQIFNRELARATGVSIPVVPAKNLNRIEFIVEARDLENEDAFEIRFPSADIMRITCSPLSARWALNHILQEFAGICYVAPGPHGTYYPKNSNIALPRKTIRKTGGFRFHRNTCVEYPEWVEFLNGKGDQTGGPENYFNHHIHKIFPYEKYNKQPLADKVMPIRKGKRFLPTTSVEWQPCYSNPECIEEGVKNICAMLEKTPNRQCFSLTVNDSGGFCTCERCVKMNGGSHPSKFMKGFISSSESYYRWCNQVVSGVLKKYPNLHFGCDAYAEVADPPSFRLHPRLTVCLATEIYQNIDPGMHENYKKLIMEWNKKADTLAFWEYGFGIIWYRLPRIYFRQIGKMMKYYKQHNGEGFFAEGDTAAFMGEGPKRYLYYRLAFDPDLSVEDELEKWYNACVGHKAAKYLSAYYNLWEEFWTSKKIRETAWFKPGIYLGHDPSYFYALDEATLNKARSLLEKMSAETRKSGDGDQIIRAERIMNAFCFSEAVAYANGAGCFPLDGKLKNETEALAFVNNIPKMSEYYKKIPIYVGKFVDQFAAEPFLNSGVPKHGIVQRSKILAFGAQINELAKYFSSPKVNAAIEKIVENENIDPVFGKVLPALLQVRKVENRIDPALSDEDEKFLWRTSEGVTVLPERKPDGSRRWKITATGGWAAAIRLVPVIPNTTYYFTAVVRAPRAYEMNYPTRLFMSSVNRYAFKLHQSYSTDTTKVARGPVSLLLVGNSSPKGYLGKAYIIINSIPPGEYVYVDSLEFKELNSPKLDRVARENSNQSVSLMPKSEFMTSHDMKIDSSNNTVDATFNVRGDKGGAFHLGFRFYNAAGKEIGNEVSEKIPVYTKWQKERFRFLLKNSKWSKAVSCRAFVRNGESEAIEVGEVVFGKE